MTCTLQGLEQGAAAGSASGAIGLLSAALASMGFRGAANRLVVARVDRVTPRMVGFASAAVAMVVLFAVMGLG